jgi:hypothetical protein
MSQTRGRPFQLGNKFSKGRPKGSRNKFDPEAKELFSQYSGPLMRTMIGMGLNKDASILKTLGPSILKYSDQSVRLGKIKAKTIEDLEKMSADLLRLAAAGKITLAQSAQLSELIEARRKVIISTDFDRRLKALEQS